MPTTCPSTNQIHEKTDFVLQNDFVGEIQNHKIWDRFQQSTLYLLDFVTLLKSLLQNILHFVPLSEISLTKSSEHKLSNGRINAK